MAETFATLNTLCFLLPQVPLAVQHQLGAHAEGLATLGALVSLVAHVVVLVHIEVEPAREVLAAQLTVVGLLTHVHRWCLVRSKRSLKLQPQ